MTHDESQVEHLMHYCMQNLSVSKANKMIDDISENKKHRRHTDEQVLL